MCEDRALRMRKDHNARLIRLYQLRFRARMLQRLQESQIRNNATSPMEGNHAHSNSAQTPVVSPDPRSTTPDQPAAATQPKEVAKTNRPPRGRSAGLIIIAMRTVDLIKKNQQLQRRLAALRAETRQFVDSVMTNPENNDSSENDDPDKQTPGASDC